MLLVTFGKDENWNIYILMKKKAVCVKLGASSTDSCILYFTYHNTISMLICCLSVEYSPNKPISMVQWWQAGKVKVYDVI